MKLGLISLGCPKNLVDSEVMLGLAQRAGHEITRNPEESDVLVVNTCAFIDKAKQESIDTILEMAEHKKHGRCRQLVVAGCLAERYRDELRAQIPEIDAIIGTGEVEQIVNAIGPGTRDPGFAGAPEDGPRLVPLLRGNGEVVPPRRGTSELGTSELGTSEPGTLEPGTLEPGTLEPGTLEPGTLEPGTREPGTWNLEPGTDVRSAPPTYLYDHDTPRLLATPRHYAYVKVAEGCDYKCAFCIIPTLRGGYRSRTRESILAEARSLAARGVKELLLVSQDTSFYGIDRGERGALSRLLRSLDEVDGLQWIRLHYLYPTTIGDDVLDAMAESDKVCAYIDLPLQHASDAVLKRMKRPGTRASYERLLERIRQRLPGVALRTTFIVGFPGETEAEFAELQSFLETVRFDHVGVFTYSHEEGTSGFALDDTVPAAVKRQRRSALMSSQRKLVGPALKARVGTHARLLVDGPSGEHELVLRGRLEGQAPEIDSCVYLTDADPSAIPAGAMIEAEIVAARGYDLVARPLVARDSA
jgi:ribosomal protein S12 methylthiotransferase